MPRNVVRIPVILALVCFVSLGSFVASGYYELHEARLASSYPDIAQHYQNAAQRIPWRADLYELSGHAYYHGKDYGQADALYQKALSRQALSPEGWIAWGDVVYLKDDPQRALQIWQDGLAQQNPSDQLYLRLARVAQERRDFSTAAGYLQKYVSIHPEDAARHYRLGLLLTLSDPDGALTELLDASRRDPKFDPAVQTLRTALNLASLSASDSEHSVIIGRGLGLVNEWQLAHAAFEDAVKADEKNAEAWAWLGEANQQTGEEGSAELERALGLNPNSPAVHGLRGLYFQRTGNFRQALVEFQVAAQSEPSNPAWLVSIGESYAGLGDLIRALEVYQAATTLAPNDPTYWRLLATFCAQNNINISDVGLPAAQQVVILGKVDAASLDLVGWLLTLASRYEEAERMLTRALELDSQNASVHLHLGMLYLQQDQRALAYDHFIQARDLGSEEADTVLKQYFP